MLKVMLAFVLAGAMTMVASIMSLVLQYKRDRQDSIPICQNNPMSGKVLPIDFWIHVWEEFLLQFSDQQLLLGLIVLVCAFLEYFHSSLGGNDNFWLAADVACFSMFNHALTMLALLTFFRKHKRLAVLRIFFMMVVFGLWATIEFYELYPSGPYHKPIRLVRFWHSATYIEYFGVSWTYVFTCFPVFISKEAITVGRAICSKDANKLREGLKVWKEKHTSSSRRWYTLLPNEFRSTLVRLLFRLENSSKRKRDTISILYVLFLSKTGTGVILSTLWFFTISALGVAFFSSTGIDSWDYGQAPSLTTALLPVQSFLSAIASAESSRRSYLQLVSREEDF
ncbi:hypothetical protein BP6252_13877 [Coleophoma cylindrospora]|uniref:Uncharacterized protein n=1 Tax=Coleophoma cylindrospora TaxID=1849047 RepID=A0A3D8Q5H4_9HELO|nr:hypothetical protein BP6252_13877 [Coleophoma cylindrospora]